MNDSQLATEIAAEINARYNFVLGSQVGQVTGMQVMEVARGEDIYTSHPIYQEIEAELRRRKSQIQ